MKISLAILVAVFVGLQFELQQVQVTVGCATFATICFFWATVTK